MIRNAARGRVVLLAATVFLSYAYFYPAGGWNQNSRFDLVRAVLERHSLSIDAYHENTGDKALSNSHFYSDKAPGLALLALPAAAVTRTALPAFGADPSSPRGLVALSYFSSLFAVALPTALACACLFWIALRLGSSQNAAAFAAVVLGLANPTWAYAVLFWGHALTGACLLFAFGAALLLRDQRTANQVFTIGLAVGLAAGWATVSEYPALPASAIVAIFAISLCWREHRLSCVSGVAIGALSCAAVLLIYQRAAFGSAFHPSYSYYQNGAFPWMQRGYMGLTYPRPDVMLKLLFGCRRGLFFAAPVLAAAPFGLRALTRRADLRAAAYCASAIAAYYFLFNASFYVWPGGWSFGPRYLGAGIPLLCVGLAPAWDAARPTVRKLLIGLAVISASISLMAVSTTPQPPDEFRCPLMQLFWPSFWSGNLSVNNVSMLIPAEDTVGSVHGAFNLGQLAGLHGLVSLLPLLLGWAAALFGWRRLREEDKAAVKA